MLAITVGVVASQLVRLIPYVGAPIVAVMWMIGGGGGDRRLLRLAAEPRAGAVPDAGRGGRAARCASRPDAGDATRRSPAAAGGPLAPPAAGVRSVRDRHLAGAAGEADLVAVGRVGEPAGGEDRAAADGAEALVVEDELARAAADLRASLGTRGGGAA